MMKAFWTFENGKKLQTTPIVKAKEHQLMIYI